LAEQLSEAAEYSSGTFEPLVFEGEAGTGH
jgi:hypothetical protein